jgi:hypothetical protein
MSSKVGTASAAILKACIILIAMLAVFAKNTSSSDAIVVPATPPPAPPAKDAAASPSPSPGPASTFQISAGTYNHTHKALYILAAGSDPVVSNALVLETYMRLLDYMGLEPDDPHPVKPSATPSPLATPSPDHHFLIPVPGWTLNDVKKQCDTDAVSTLGALIIGPYENDSGSHNYVLYADGYVHLDTALFWITCAGADDANPGLSLLWEAPKHLSSYRNHGSVPLIGLAGLATYFASRTTQTTTQVQVTQAGPKATDGSQMTIANQTQKQSNNSNLGYGLAILSSAFVPLQTITVPGVNTPRILKNVSAAIATDILKTLRDECKYATRQNIVTACNKTFDKQLTLAVTPK